MAKGRRYVRDNRGRFASVGATARGGRIAKASGRRVTVTAKAKGAAPKGTISKPRGLKPNALEPKIRGTQSTGPTAIRGKRLGGKSQRLEFRSFYHGTSRVAAESIRNGGYRSSAGGYLGKGVYVSSSKKVAGFYTGNDGSVLRHRVSARSLKDVKVGNYMNDQRKATKLAQSAVKSGKVGVLKAANNLQSMALMSPAHASRTLVRSTGTIRKPRRRR